LKVLMPCLVLESLKLRRLVANTCEDESSECPGTPVLKKFLPPASPPRNSVLSISHILDTDVVPRNLKRERRDSLTPELSDDEERRMHASFLLNLAESPEAVSRTPSEAASSPSLRKKSKSRYADTINRPFAHMIRPAYEFMSESSTTIPPMRYRQSVPESPPQSPPEMTQRVRARPYSPLTMELTFSGRCARRAQGCNENTKFRPVISDWTCYKNYEPCPKDSQVGWCNKCWCNKGYVFCVSLY
jgi:hypothetical protein